MDSDRLAAIAAFGAAATVGTLLAALRAWDFDEAGPSSIDESAPKPDAGPEHVAEDAQEDEEVQGDGIPEGFGEEDEIVDEVGRVDPGPLGLAVPSGVPSKLSAVVQVLEEEVGNVGLAICVSGSSKGELADGSRHPGASVSSAPELTPLFSSPAPSEAGLESVSRLPTAGAAVGVLVAACAQSDGAERRIRDAVGRASGGGLLGAGGAAQVAWLRARELEGGASTLLEERRAALETGVSEGTLLARPSRWLVAGSAEALLGREGSDASLANLILRGGKSGAKILVRADRGSAHAARSLLLYATHYGLAYVASVADARGLRAAVREARDIRAPAVVVVWSAPVTGDVPLFEWDPRRERRGLDPLKVWSDAAKESLKAVRDAAGHLAILARTIPQGLETTTTRSPAAEATARLVGSFERLAQAVGAADEKAEPKPPLRFLYASDGGNAAGVARALHSDAVRRGLSHATLSALDDAPPPASMLVERDATVVVVVSTAGQGELPANGREFGAALQSSDMPSLEGVGLRFAVFGLGDSHYWADKKYYNKAARDLDTRLALLGAERLVSVGLGDDQADDGFREGLQVWTPLLWEALGVPTLDNNDDAEDEAAAAAVRSDEDIKRNSGLMGPLATDLHDHSTGAISYEGTKLIKHHGIYQQDDRDLRAARRKAGLEPAFQFMIRVRLPAGVCSPRQWLAVDQLSVDRGNHTFKLTTRQTFQLHGVIKRNLVDTVRALNAELMDTLAACGDVNRGVMASSLPVSQKVHRDVAHDAQIVSDHLTPRTSAYHELWLGKKRVAGGPVDEPIYGPAYLPRKFKIAFAVPPVNDVDVFAHCLGFVAVVESASSAPSDYDEHTESKHAEPSSPRRNLFSSPSSGGGAAASRVPSSSARHPSSSLPLGSSEHRSLPTGPRTAWAAEEQRLVGYNVFVGGGMGMTHGNESTYPCLSESLGFISREDVVRVSEAIVTTQRDWGDRENRKHARFKYTVEDRGLDAVRSEVERRSGVRFQPTREAVFEHNGDKFGWTRATDGRYYLTLFIQGGRVRDDADCQLRTGLAKVCALLARKDAEQAAGRDSGVTDDVGRVRGGADVTRTGGREIRITANQNLILGGIASLEEKQQIEDILTAHHIPFLSTSSRPTVSRLRLNSIACVALPTCGLAMAESERYLPSLVSKIDTILDQAGLFESDITIRMTGCPNGCARPYVAEIALVGKAPGHYNLYLGAGHAGQRLGKLYRATANEDAIIAALRPLLHRYARERNPGEYFGDWCVRANVVKATNRGSDFHKHVVAPPPEEAAAKDAEATAALGIDF